MYVMTYIRVALILVLIFSRVYWVLSFIFGMSYCLNIETEEPDEEDILLDISAVKIYIDPMSAGILKDTTVDYITTLQQEGFVFNNPAANTTCGCGSSFS